MRLLLIIFILIGFSFSSFGQVTVGLTVLSSDSIPVPFANVLSSNDSFLNRTDINGNTHLVVHVGSELTISHIEYELYSLIISAEKSNFIIYLKERIEQLPDAIVTPDPLPEVVFQDEKYHVADFLFIDDIELVLPDIVVSIASPNLMIPEFSSNSL